jgi:hypothetical protein
VVGFFAIRSTALQFFNEESEEKLPVIGRKTAFEYAKNTTFLVNERCTLNYLPQIAQYGVESSTYLPEVFLHGVNPSSPIK